MTESSWQSLMKLAWLPSKADAHERLMEIGTAYRAEENQLVAGLAFEHAAHAAWGNPAGMEAAFVAAMASYASVNEHHSNCSLEGLAARVKLVKLSWKSYLAPHAAKNLDRAPLTEELAQLIVTCFGSLVDAESYLVRGAQLRIASDGSVTANFPAYEVDMGLEHGSPPDGWIVHLAPAFQLFVSQADYVAARTIADRFPTAFTSAGLRGWRWAVLGFTGSDDAPAHFREASAAFAEDVLADGVNAAKDGSPSWSGVNSQLWAPYFAARALMAEIRVAPHRATELVAAAAACKVSESGWIHPQALAFGALVASLNQLLTAGSADVRAIRDQFKAAMLGLGASPEFELVEEFATLAADAFDGFVHNPEEELTIGRIATAIEVLGRIPLLDEGVAKAVVPAIGRKALSELLGGQRTWMHRTLESIQDEGILQKIVLRLLQSSLPSYAQILHGPLEYGKDIVALLRRDGEVVLRMYQLKAGDINTRVWADARREMEDMFLVPLSEFQFVETPDRREGVLLCNGHCNPFVQPAMEGWFGEQRRDHHRDIRFEHLDSLVAWITKERLITELRLALNEYGVPIL